MKSYGISIVIFALSTSYVLGQSCSDVAPDPRRKDAYIQIVHGAQVVRVCAPGTVFHPTKCICNFPEISSTTLQNLDTRTTGGKPYQSGALGQSLPSTGSGNSGQVNLGHLYSHGAGSQTTLHGSGNIGHLYAHGTGSGGQVSSHRTGISGQVSSQGTRSQLAPHLTRSELASHGSGNAGVVFLHRHKQGWHLTSNGNGNTGDLYSHVTENSGHLSSQRSSISGHLDLQKTELVQQPSSPKIGSVGQLHSHGIESHGQLSTHDRTRPSHPPAGKRLAQVYSPGTDQSSQSSLHRPDGQSYQPSRHTHGYPLRDIPTTRNQKGDILYSLVSEISGTGLHGALANAMGGKNLPAKSPFNFKSFTERQDTNNSTNNPPMKVQTVPAEVVVNEALSTDAASQSFHTTQSTLYLSGTHQSASNTERSGVSSQTSQPPTLNNTDHSSQPSHARYNKPQPSPQEYIPSSQPEQQPHRQHKHHHAHNSQHVQEHHLKQYFQQQSQQQHQQEMQNNSQPQQQQQPLQYQQQHYAPKAEEPQAQQYRQQQQQAQNNSQHQQQQHQAQNNSQHQQQQQQAQNNSQHQQQQQQAQNNSQHQQQQQQAQNNSQQQEAQQYQRQHHAQQIQKPQSQHYQPQKHQQTQQEQIAQWPQQSFMSKPEPQPEPQQQRQQQQQQQNQSQQVHQEQQQHGAQQVQEHQTPQHQQHPQQTQHYRRQQDQQPQEQVQVNHWQQQTLQQRQPHHQQQQQQQQGLVTQRPQQSPISEPEPQPEPQQQQQQHSQLSQLYKYLQHAQQVEQQQQHPHFPQQQQHMSQQQTKQYILPQMSKNSQTQNENQSQRYQHQQHAQALQNNHSQQNRQQQPQQQTQQHQQTQRDHMSQWQQQPSMSVSEPQPEPQPNPILSSVGSVPSPGPDVSLINKPEPSFKRGFWKHIQKSPNTFQSPEVTSPPIIHHEHNPYRLHNPAALEHPPKTQNMFGLLNKLNIQSSVTPEPPVAAEPEPKPQTIRLHLSKPEPIPASLTLHQYKNPSSLNTQRVRQHESYSEQNSQRGRPVAAQNPWFHYMPNTTPKPFSQSYRVAHTTPKPFLNGRQLSHSTYQRSYQSYNIQDLKPNAPPFSSRRFDNTEHPKSYVSNRFAYIQSQHPPAQHMHYSGTVVSSDPLSKTYTIRISAPASDAHLPPNTSFSGYVAHQSPEHRAPATQPYPDAASTLPTVYRAGETGSRRGYPRLSPHIGLEQQKQVMRLPLHGQTFASLSSRRTDPQRGISSTLTQRSHQMGVDRSSVRSGSRPNQGNTRHSALNINAWTPGTAHLGQYLPPPPGGRHDANLPSGQTVQGRGLSKHQNFPNRFPRNQGFLSSYFRQHNHPRYTFGVDTHAVGKPGYRVKTVAPLSPGFKRTDTKVQSTTTTTVKPTPAAAPGVATWKPDPNLPWRTNIAQMSALDTPEWELFNYIQKVLKTEKNLSAFERMELSEMMA